ncbi:MAG: peptidase M50 [Nostocales cyanobacterium]|nr:MAG: peptidase M50 [Nostocales cyanobacterium]
MNTEEPSGFNKITYQNSLCPNLTNNWQLNSVPYSEQVQLKAIKTKQSFLFSATEGYALQHFNGKFTVTEVHERCKTKFGKTISANFMVQLLEKLVALGVLKNPHATSPLLKSGVEWRCKPSGYWLLRLQKSDSIAYVQVSNYDKNLMLELGKVPVKDIVDKYKISPQYLQDLLQNLAIQGMLEGVELPKQKKQFNLLFFKFSLFNPDRLLSLYINKIRFLFTTEACFLICLFLGFTTVLAFSKHEIIHTFGQELWNQQNYSLILPFLILMMLVVSIHELGHAFTLKHYNGVVLEIGIMFICLLPGAYTNTTDAYGLVKRRQRTLVMAAGVICQVIIWGTAVCLWTISKPGTWFYTATYLLMIAAQFTLALNLNPLNKFDGYYILEAMTDINHLRQRSFAYYAQLWRREESPERTEDRGILAIYAPACLVYIIWIFGSLFFWLWHLTAPYLPGQ